MDKDRMIRVFCFASGEAEALSHKIMSAFDNDEDRTHAMMFVGAIFDRALDELGSDATEYRDQVKLGICDMITELRRRET